MIESMNCLCPTVLCLLFVFAVNFVKSPHNDLFPIFSIFPIIFHINKRSDNDDDDIRFDDFVVTDFNDID